MISLKELNPNGYELTPKQQQNLEVLLERMNKVRLAFGKPMIITSGVRSAEDQRRIYHNATKIPWGSQHLQAAACDVADRTGVLKGWIKDNVKLLEEVGLWCEDLTATPGWVHFQIYPPASGMRFFRP